MVSVRPFLLLGWIALGQFAVTPAIRGDDQTKKAMKAIHQAGGYIGGDSSGRPVKLLISYATKDPESVVQNLKYLKGIETIECTGNHKVTHPWLRRFIEDAPGLTRLEVGGIDDGGLEIIGKGKNIEYLKIASIKMTDAGLKYVAALKNLRELRIGSAQFTNAGFKELARLPELHTISYAYMSDETLKGVGKIDGLRTLDFTNVAPFVKAERWKEIAAVLKPDAIDAIKKGVTDDGLKELKDLKKLRSLKLLLRPITDAGAKHLAALEGLEYLNLNETKITDEALKAIGKMKNLKRLRVEKTQIGDAGLAYLGQLENLKTLDLCNTKVGDAGIIQLAHLKELRVISVGGSAVTQQGRVAFSRLNKHVLIKEVADPFDRY